MSLRQKFKRSWIHEYRRCLQLSLIRDEFRCGNIACNRSAVNQLDPSRTEVKEELVIP